MKERKWRSQQKKIKKRTGNNEGIAKVDEERWIEKSGSRSQ